jgi:peptidyl-prolyl cis-trans isomerase D
LAAIIDREIRPSKNTYDNIFNTASSFSINNNNYEAFKTAGAEYGIQTAGYIRENDKALGNLETPRPLIRWAYEASKGDVSEPFEMEDKFVVASLTNIREKGILPLDEIEDLIRVEVLNEKKAEFIKSQVTGKTDLNSIASTLGESVQLADNVSFSDYTIPGIGPEGAILGTLITLQPNQISESIEGKRGVYIIQLNSLNQMQEAVAEVVTSDLNRGLQSRVDFETFNSLKENANIVDNRGKFY